MDALDELKRMQAEWDKEEHDRIWNRPSFWEEMEDQLTVLSVATKCDWEIFYNRGHIDGLPEDWVANCGHMAGPLEDILKVVHTSKDMGLGEMGSDGTGTIDLINYHQYQKAEIDAVGDTPVHYRV
jgi:hypothetical protein